MTATLLRATEPDAIMHKDVISHAGIHQEAPFSSRRETRRAERAAEMRAGKHGGRSPRKRAAGDG